MKPDLSIFHEQPSFLNKYYITPHSPAYGFFPIAHKRTRTGVVAHGKADITYIGKTAI